MSDRTHPVRLVAPHVDPAVVPQVTAPPTGSCARFGHEIDNRTVVADGNPRCRRCGQPFLFEDGRVSHTRHVLGCFLRHHTYIRIDRRAGHNEYTCVRCGHPLLLAVDADPHEPLAAFPKRVRYLCGVFGHAVHEVTARGGFIEYACDCGHSFLLAEEGLTRVTHPFICRVSGHRVAFVEQRGRCHEYRCLDCGHTFGWMDADAGLVRPTEWAGMFWSGQRRPRTRRW